MELFSNMILKYFGLTLSLATCAKIVIKFSKIN